LRKRNKVNRSEGKKGDCGVSQPSAVDAGWPRKRFAARIANAAIKTSAGSSMRRMSAWAALAAALALAAAASGCGPKVSAENYDKIANGMKEDRVAGILAIASESRNTTVKVPEGTFTSTISKLRNDKGTILVEFLNGEVQSKQYFPPGTEPKSSRNY
jgi:hypothetical protein